MKNKTIPSEYIFILIVLFTLLIISFSFENIKTYKEKYSYTGSDNYMKEKTEAQEYNNAVSLEYLIVLILLVVVLKIESERLISKRITEFIRKIGE